MKKSSKLIEDTLKSLRTKQIINPLGKYIINYYI